MKVLLINNCNGELPTYLLEIPVYTRFEKNLYFQGMAAKPNNCLNCGKLITKGRANKKFCDSYCKDEFNNAAKIAEGKEISKISTILKHNRRSLKKLFDPDKPDKKFSRELLIRAGFEFGFLTHIAVTKGKSNEIKFCFDYGYREIESNHYQLYHSFSKVKVKDGYEVKVT